MFSSTVFYSLHVVFVPFHFFLTLLAKAKSRSTTTLYYSYGVALSLLLITLQILPNNPCNNPYRHSPLLINLRHGKAHIILFPGCPVTIAGMGHRNDTVGQPDIDHSFMNIRYLSRILALDTAFFQVFMVCPGSRS